ncbi:MAG: hypothetical protein ACTSPB_04535 [Candidatus Thorarchaeota archaeon]
MAKTSYTTAGSNAGRGDNSYTVDSAKANGAGKGGDLWTGNRSSTGGFPKPSKYGNTGGPLRQSK